MYKKKMMLENYRDIADKHANRLKHGLTKIVFLHIATSSDFKKLSNAELDITDVTIIHFIKLYETISFSIFNRILPIITEDSHKLFSFIDKLNKLEKLEYLASAEWWITLEESQKRLLQDYPTDYENITKHLQELIILAPQLLDYWEILKIKMIPLYSKTLD